MWHSNQGVNNVMVRQANRKNIKKLLYKEGSLTKQEITTLLSLSLPTVNLLVQQLKDEKLITEQTSEVSSGGRRPQLLCFNYDAKVAVGLEISQNHNRLVLLNMKNEVLDSRRIRRAFEDSDDYWKGCIKLIMEILGDNKIGEEQVLGAGIAVPGIVEHEKKLVEFAPTLRLRKFKYSHLEEMYPIPVMVENEAKAAGFAEVWNKDIIENAVYLSITKGVGGAIIIDNKVFSGRTNRSGEFGHMTLIHDGEPCSCGKLGCFEAYCSTKRLTDYSNGDLDEFFCLIKAGDKKLADLWNEYMDYLAIGISNLKIAFDTDIIIGGDLEQYIRESYETIHEKVRQRMLYEEAEPLFRTSNTGKNAAAVGSALMLISDYLDK